MKIALVGGSFDPLHLGHLALATNVLWRKEPDAVWLMPVARHAFGKALSPFEARFAMAKLGAELLFPHAEARADEAELVGQGGDGTTIALVRHLIATCPNDQFLLALGADAYAERAAWREFEALERLCEIVVCNRFGFPEVPDGGPPLAAVSSSEVRARVHAGQPIAALVPAAIDRYIRARALYD